MESWFGFVLPTSRHRPVPPLSIEPAVSRRAAGDSASASGAGGTRSAGRPLGSKILNEYLREHLSRPEPDPNPTCRPQHARDVSDALLEGSVPRLCGGEERKQDSLPALLCAAAAPWLQSLLASLLVKHRCEENITPGPVKNEDSHVALVPAVEGDVDAASMQADADVDAGAALAVLRDSFEREGNHLKTMTAQAADLGMVRKTLMKHKHAIASCLLQTSSMLWTSALQRVKGLIESKHLRAIALIKKRVYDETPLRMRIRVQDEKKMKPITLLRRLCRHGFRLGCFASTLVLACRSSFMAL